MGELLQRTRAASQQGSYVRVHNTGRSLFTNFKHTRIHTHHGSIGTEQSMKHARSPGPANSAVAVAPWPG